MADSSKSTQPQPSTASATTSATPTATATAQKSTSSTASTSAPSAAAAPITISNCSHHCGCGCYVKPPTTTSTTKKVVSYKAAAALTAAEIDRMIDLGLGRGIDATDSKPWINKSAFQVRRVTAEGVLGTEEGGSLQSYEREVTSVLSHQTDLKASVIVPQSPVQIGMDAEQSRSVSSTRRTVGKKVLNRSISFRSDFSDVPQVGVSGKSHREGKQHKEGEDKEEEEDPEESVADIQEVFLTFEQRLSKWIVKRVLQRQELTAQQAEVAGRTVGKPKFVANSTAQSDPVTDLSYFLYVSNEEERKKIIHDCYDFVKYFRITHYVSSIELGAVEYRVFSETDFNSTIGAGGALAIEKLVNLSITHKRTSRKFKKASDVKTIGKISTEGKVSRGTHDEAVVGIRVQPISRLVKLPYLRLAIQRSLVHYMDEQGDSSSGPFLIASGSERSLRFWSVDDDYTVRATSNPQNASLFFIISSDSGSHPYEFHIAYMGDNQHRFKKRVSSLTPLNQKSVQAIPRYLNAEVSAFGHNHGPLRLEYHVSDRSRLLLFGRVENKDGPISAETWTQGRDMFFINCARRRMKWDGYVAVRRHRRHGEEEWITSCYPRRRDHNERSVFMLFRLLPASYRDNPELFAAERGKMTTGANGLDDSMLPFDDMDDVKSLDEQLQKYGKGSAPNAFRAPPSPLPQPKKKQALEVTLEEDTRVWRETLAPPQPSDIHLPLLDAADLKQPVFEDTSQL